jgi:uncharacterized protein
MKIIIDTNIHISALAFGGSIGSNLGLILSSNQIEVFTSEAIFRELESKLNSSKFEKISKGKISQPEINEYLLEYNQETNFIEPKIKVNICRDTDDNKFLELALEIQADYIITGDKDLLSIGNYLNTKILNMAEFISDVL